MNIPAEETVAFGRELREQWKDSEDFSAIAWRQRYCASMLIGAISGADAYWKLRVAMLNLEAAIVCRTLLERVAGAFAARKDMTVAVELIAYPIHNSIEGIKRWNNNLGGTLKDFDRMISDRQEKIEHLSPLMKGKRYKNWKVRDVFKFAELDHLYTSAYFELCSYSHGDYFTALDPDPHSGVFDYVAAMAPMEIGRILLILKDGSNELPAPYEHRYWELVNRAKSTYLQKRPNG